MILRHFNSVPPERARGHRVGVLQCSGSIHLTISSVIKGLVRSSASVAVAVPFPTGSFGRVGGHRVGVGESPGRGPRASVASERSPSPELRCGAGAGAVRILPSEHANQLRRIFGVSGGEASI